MSTDIDSRLTECYSRLAMAEKEQDRVIEGSPESLAIMRAARRKVLEVTKECLRLHQEILQRRTEESWNDSQRIKQLQTDKLNIEELLSNLRSEELDLQQQEHREIHHRTELEETLRTDAMDAHVETESWLQRLKKFFSRTSA